VLALAVDFERHESKAKERQLDQDQGSAAFYVGGADDVGAEGLVFVPAMATEAVVAGGSVCTTPLGDALYDDEPHDIVYYQALAAGEIEPALLTPRNQRQAHSGPQSAGWMASEDNKEWTGLWEKDAFEDVAYLRGTEATSSAVGVQDQIRWYSEVAGLC
jgi:hypothetical protein